ncbi:hypothetical protein [Microcoleus sp. K5-D4]|uniref:hypothetical protein n=1 Tax=Microcoleus sp. K5-D4 TaxID=2818801 RepID=UPI002FD7186E
MAIVLLIIELALLTEYFVFPNVKLVLNDLYGMEPKMLSGVELALRVQDKCDSQATTYTDTTSDFS